MIQKQFIYMDGAERKTITFKIEETGIVFNYSSMRGISSSRYCAWQGTTEERYYANIGGQIEKSNIPSALREVIFNFDGDNCITMKAGDDFHNPFSEIPNYQDGVPSTIPGTFGKTMYTEQGNALHATSTFQWFTFLDKTVNPNVDVGFNGGLFNFPKNISGVNYGFTASVGFAYPLISTATPKIAFWTAILHDDDTSSPTYGQDFKILVQSFNAMSYNPASGGTISISDRAIFTDMRLLDAANVNPKQGDGARNVTPYGRNGTYNFTSDKMVDVAPTGYSFINRWQHGLTLFHLNDYQAEALFNEFWGNDTLYQRWLNSTVKPVQGVICMHKLPFSVGSGSRSKPMTIFGKRIVSGQLLDAVPLVNEQIIKIPASPQWVRIEEIYGDFFDYAGESKLSVYLPFIGTVPIDVNKIMDGAIMTVYYFDVLTGNCIARVYGRNGMQNGAEVLLYQGCGNAALSIPYVGNDQGGMKQLGAVAGIATAGLATLATGGAAAAPAMAAITGASQSLLAEKNESVNSIPTECNPLTYPYVCYIQTYPERTLADLQRSISGWAAASGKSGSTVNDYTGFLQGVFHAEIDGATDAEKAAIEDSFRNGVIV